MKIVHIQAGTLKGGAARGAYWLHKAELKHGLDSKLIIFNKENFKSTTVTSPKFNIFSISCLYLTKFMKIIILSLYPKRNKIIYFNIGFEALHNILHHPCIEEADIVHLHWINGLISLNNIQSIKQPIVWTIRDMWPFTGGCHYSMDCSRYITGCGKCPALFSSNANDFTAKATIQKKLISKKNIFYVGISNWISRQARASFSLQNANIRTINNGIDLESFMSLDKLSARRILGIPENKKVLLFGSNKHDDFYKGFHIIDQALSCLDLSKCCLLCFGKSLPNSFHSKYRDILIDLGFVADNKKLSTAYSSATLFLMPSLYEAFGKTIVESLSCGTPVVCFDSTAPADLVDHKITGYKARAFSAKSFSKGINYILNQPSEVLQTMSHNCINGSRKYSSLITAKNYIKLYESILA